MVAGNPSIYFLNIAIILMKDEQFSTLNFILILKNFFWIYILHTGCLCLICRKMLSFSLIRSEKNPIKLKNIQVTEEM